MPKVTFEREGITVEAKRGESLLRVAQRSGVDVFRGIWKDLHCGDSVTGLCNRCKVWVKPLEAGAVNAPTRAEKLWRPNGRVNGTMRLACKVSVIGDVAVHTRSAGQPTRANTNWQASTEPSKWKDRWDARASDGGEADAEDAGKAE